MGTEKDLVTSIETAYYIGWVEALLYVQAHNDVEGGSQTITTHLPGDFANLLESCGGPSFRFDKDKLKDIMQDQDEGGTAGCRFGKDKWGSDTIEVAGSEGFHGFPEWR
jgi:hypothetical protein